MILPGLSILFAPRHLQNSQYNEETTLDEKANLDFDSDFLISGLLH